MNVNNSYYRYIKEALYDKKYNFSDVARQLNIGRYLTIKYCSTFFPTKRPDLMYAIIDYLSLNQATFFRLMIQNIENIEKDKCNHKIDLLKTQLLSNIKAFNKQSLQIQDLIDDLSSDI